MSQMPDSFHRLASPATCDVVARQIGEPDDAVAKGFEVAIPMVAIAVANRSDDPDFLDELVEIAGRVATQPYPLSTAGRLNRPDPGIDTATASGRWLLQLFGEDRPDAIGHIGDFAGIRRSSAGSILSVSAPLVLAYLAQVMNERHLSATGLRDWLRAQRSQLVRELPDSLRKGGERPLARPAPVPEPIARGASYLFHQPLASSWNIATAAVLCVFGLGGTFWLIAPKHTAPQARVEITEVVTAIGGVPIERATEIDAIPVGTTGLSPVLDHRISPATGIVPWILLGIVVGLVMHLVTPPRLQQDIFTFAGLGAAGAVIGGMAGTLLGVSRAGQSAVYMIAMLGAMAVLIAARQVKVHGFGSFRNIAGIRLPR